MNVKYVTQKNVSIADCLSCLVNIKRDNCKDDPTLDLQIADLGVHNDIKIDWAMIRQQIM